MNLKDTKELIGWLTPSERSKLLDEVLDYALNLESELKQMEYELRHLEGE